jgi:hypothetical protein
MDLRACGTGSKTPGGIPASSKAKLTVLLRKEGFTVSSSTVGRILKSLKTRGLLREGEKPKAHGGIRDPMLRENRKTARWNLPGSCRHRYLRSRPLPGRVYKQFTAKDLILRWASSSLHSRATESSQSVPRGTPKGTPFPVRAIQVDGGSEFYGEFEGPRRNTVSSSSSFLQDLPHPWNGGTAQSDLPGGFFGPSRRRWIVTP